MRKFSKILTVFLTVCLLAGVLAATVTSAASPAYKTIKEHATGYADHTRSGVDNAPVVTPEGNEYYRYFTESFAGGDACRVQFNSGKTALNGYDYVVWDLNFTADQYIDGSGALVDPKTVSSTEGLKLSYINALRFYHAQLSSPIAYIVEGTGDDAGKWFASTGSAYNPGSGRVHIPLEEEVGIWNHLTWVLDVRNMYVYLYINGQYLDSKATTKDLSAAETQFYMRTNNSTPAGSLSVGIDSVIETGFLKGYKPTEGIYSIADYFGGETVDTSKPIYMCDDMVYSLNYTYEGAKDAQYTVEVDTVANGTLKYSFPEGAVRALSKMTADEINNATIYTKRSIRDFTLPDGFRTINIVAKGGAEFSLSQEMIDLCYTVDAVDNGDGTVSYTVKVGDYANVVFVDDKGSVIATKRSFINGPLKTIDVQVPVTYLNNGEYKVLDHWEMKDADGKWFAFNGNEEILCSDYVFYASDIYTPGVNSVVVKAAYKEEELDFAVLKKLTNSLVITEEISQDMYLDSRNLAACVNAAKEEVTLVLHNDAEIASIDSIKVKENTVLNVDLNGNTLSQTDGVMFIVKDGATLNITSAEKGAVLQQMADKAETALIAGDNKANSYNINIINQAENEITVNAGTLVDIKGGEYDAEIKMSTATDEVPVVININGGNYNAETELSGAMFNIATTEVELNITDANICNNVNGAIFASELAGNVDFADADIKVSGTTLCANGYVLGSFGKDVAIEIGDSKIIGDMFGKKVDGTVTFGEYTYIQLGSNAIKYTEVALVEDVVIAESCAPVRANLYDEEFDVYYGIILLNEAVIDENTVTVTWLDPNGDVFAVEEWFKGSVAVGYDTSDFGVLTDTKNGWYTLGYASWEDENAVDLKYNPDYTLDKDVTFRPVKGLVASVAVKVNMSLLTKFEANIYIPLTTPENVEILGLFTHYDVAYGPNYRYHVDESALGYDMIDGMDYAKHSFYFDNSDIDKSVTRYLAIMVDGEVMVQPVTVDLLGYAETVMEQYGCGSEEAVLAYNLINYAHEAYKFKANEEYAPAADFLALSDHDAETCGCSFVYDYDLDEVSLNYKAGLGENVYGVSYDISNEMPAFVVYANTDKNGTSLVKRVKVQFYGINSSVDDVMFEYNLTLVRGEDVVIEDKTYSTFSFKSMPLYNAAEVMTVTVTNADGTENTSTYSLATYIDHFSCYPADGSGLEVAKALYSFAKVANGYKNLAD